MLIHELLRDPAQQKPILIVRLDLALEPDPVHQVDRDGDLTLCEGLQKLFLKHPGYGWWRTVPVILTATGLGHGNSVVPTSSTDGEAGDIKADFTVAYGPVRAAFYNPVQMIAVRMRTQAIIGGERRWQARTRSFCGLKARP